MKTPKGHDLEVVTHIYARCKSCSFKIRIEVGGLRGELGKRLALELRRADGRHDCHPCVAVKAADAERSAFDGIKAGPMAPQQRPQTPAEIDAAYAAATAGVPNG